MLAQAGNLADIIFYLCVSSSSPTFLTFLAVVSAVLYSEPLKDFQCHTV